MVVLVKSKMSRKGGEIVKEGYLTKSPPVDKTLAVSWVGGGGELLTCGTRSSVRSGNLV